MPLSRRSALKLCLLGAPSVATGGALEDGEPTLENFNLVEKVLGILRGLPGDKKYDQLRPHTYVYNDKKFSYYLNEIAVIGRCPTVLGSRNIIFCGYTRSAAYINEQTDPARGHRFLLCLTDKPDLEFFIRIEPWRHEVTLNDSVLSVGLTKLDLRKQEEFRIFREGGW